MKINKNMKQFESVEKEDGVDFKSIRVFIENNETYNPGDFVKMGLYKIVATVNNISRTYYYKDGVETSKEKIIHDERMKNLRR